MHNFRELKIWNRARVLVKEIYQLTKSLPSDELYGLNSQIRRAVISIPTNIAEGCGRNSDKELVRYLNIANGSAFELETLLILASDLNMIEETDTNYVISEINEIEKMIFNFKQKLSNE